jgi:hypothetical protein
MIIKKDTRPPTKKINFLKTALLIYFISTFSVAILLSIFFFTSHSVKTKTLKVLDYISKAGRLEYIHIFSIARDSLMSNFYELDKIDLEIKFEDILILEEERARAIKNKSLGLKDNLTKVKAKISFKDKKFSAKIRLKGDRLIHFNKKKHSSYNVYLSSNKFIKGVNDFSIQKPGVRNYIHEWIFLEIMGDLGLIKPKYEFFNLYINGTNNGLYVLEEKMRKEIVERNQRRNGPIFSILGEFDRGSEDIIFQIYDEKFWTKPENIRLTQIAKMKISEFMRGDRKLEDTFDVEKLAAFVAVMDLTYTTHALFFSSKLYYNPVNGLFEPIPRDGHRQLPNYHKFNQNYYNKLIIDSINEPENFKELGGNLQIPEGRQWWIKKFFLDESGSLNKNFYASYLKYLKKISSDKYLNSFLQSRGKQIKRINSHIYSDYFFYSSSRDYTWGLYFFDKNDLFHRADIIKNRIESEEKKISAIINQNDILEIDVSYPYINAKNNKKLDHLLIKDITCSANENEIINIPINELTNLFETTKVNLKNRQKKIINCFYVDIKDLNLNKNYKVKIDQLNSKISFIDFKIYEKNKLNKYFIEKNNKIYLKSNNITIDENIYIPKNKTVLIKGGQTITLINNAFIISDSSWILKGEKELPITITGKKKNFGGGILIRDGINKSFFNYVKLSYLAGYKKDLFDNSTNIVHQIITYDLENGANSFKEKKIIKNNSSIRDNEFIIMGALNFHQTKVQMSNIIVKKISSEDGINIINSTFNISDIKFSENASDSIDFDFSDGKISNASFINIGNDGIDFSGSDVSVENIYFEKIGDKLISAGENSIISILDIKAKNAYAGIVSKDGSKVKASKISMKNINLPFLSFNKKFEYESASMQINFVSIDNNFNQKWLTDKNSKIYLNGTKVGKITKNIIPIVYNKDLSLLETEIN